MLSKGSSPVGLEWLSYLSVHDVGFPTRSRTRQILPGW